MFQFCKGNILEGLICLLHVLSCSFLKYDGKGAMEEKNHVSNTFQIILSYSAVNWSLK